MMKIFILLSCCYLVQIDGKAQKTGPLIYNGQKANLGDFPWMAALVYKGAYAGGGSLISKDWILTAAHCVYQTNPQDYIINLGVLRKEDAYFPFAVHSMVIHPLYDPGPTINDAAVLRLQQSVQFSYNIKPILLESKFIGAGVSATISGWGQYSEDWLRFVTVETITNHECQPPMKAIGRIDNSNICVLQSGPVVETACPGDSGSPVVHGWGSSTPSQIGIVSWGNPDCKIGYPGVETRISSIRQWITQITGV